MRSTRLTLLALSIAALLGATQSDAQSLRTDGPAVRLLQTDFATAAPRWSPDGTRLAFTTPDYTGLWVADVASGSFSRLSTASGVGFGATWSPDSDEIVARASRYDGPTRLHSVVVFDVEANTATSIGEEEALMPSLPVWIDASHVGVMRSSGFDVSPTRDDAGTPSTAEKVVGWSGGIGVADASNGAVAELKLFNEDVTIINITPSPDGRRVAFEVMGGGLHVANADGSGLIDLGIANRPSWSPDGAWLVAMTTEDDGHEITGSDLVAFRTDGSARVMLTQTVDRLEMNPSWSPDGRRIAFDDMSDGALYILPVRD